MNAGYAGSNVAATDRSATLNERLNRLVEGLQCQCERIQGVLGRVNGTPPTPISTGATLGQGSVPRPHLPLANAVEALEHAHARLSDLANAVEQIA